MPGCYQGQNSGVKDFVKTYTRQAKNRESSLLPPNSLCRGTSWSCKVASHLRLPKSMLPSIRILLRRCHRKRSDFDRSAERLRSIVKDSVAVSHEELLPIIQNEWLAKRLEIGRA